MIELDVSASVFTMESLRTAFFIDRSKREGFWTSSEVSFLLKYNLGVLTLFSMSGDIKMSWGVFSLFSYFIAGSSVSTSGKLQMNNYYVFLTN